MAKLRAALVWFMLFVEALITAPFFALSWVISALGFAIVAGFKFARMDDDKARRKVLDAMLGGGNQ